MTFRIENKYSINNEKYNGLQFRKKLKELSDEDLMAADITVENDDVASTIVKTRRQDLILDTKIDIFVNPNLSFSQSLSKFLLFFLCQ
mgnify:CR=1 FL=1